jgi:DNA sulfur modification protein DndD
MASILNSISFKNFYNYYGDFEENHYELSDGVNIIVADNGAGKSKFFNAFLWLFQDQVLDSDAKRRGDSGIRNLKDVCVKVISDKAKIETSMRDSVDCGIRIEYTLGDRYRYQIIKSFNAIRIGEDITDEKSWQFTINDVEVNRTELVLTKYKPIYEEDEKRRVIDQLIMPAFRKYSFLQGEEVDEIIDFGQKSSIEEAVQNITDIKKYEKLSELTDYFKERAWKDLSSQNKSNDEQSKRLDEAIKEREDFQKRLDIEQKKLSEFERTFEDAEKEKNELEKHHANAEKRKELDDKLKPLNKRLRDKANDFEEFLDRINNRFFDGNSSWIAMGFDDEIDKYRSLNEKFIEKHFEKKTLLDIEDSSNGYIQFLPLDSPDMVSINNMIDNEHCYVCDRPARKGTAEHDYLIKLKNRPSDQAKDKPFVKNNLKEFFGGLQINAQPFYSRIPVVRESVTSVRSKEEEFKDQIDRLKKQVKSLKDQRKDILVAGHDSEASSTEIISSYSGAIKRMESARNKIDDIIRPRINNFKGKIQNIENEIESLNKVQDIPEGYQLNFSIFRDLAEATSKAKERVYDNMIRLLEEHANRHFQNLISNNDLKGGILKFEKSPSGSITFNYIDSKGHLVHGSSEGFQRMKKFSVVMAIITANSSQYNYPLLADAPISAFGEGFTEGFFDATGDIFPQSIILVKELFKRTDDHYINDLGKKLLKEDMVKTFYVNTVPKDAEQVEIVTTQTRLK